MGACCNTADQVTNSECVVPGNNTGVGSQLKGGHNNYQG